MLKNSFGVDLYVRPQFKKKKKMKREQERKKHVSFTMEPRDSVRMIRYCAISTRLSRGYNVISRVGTSRTL